jgi:transposase
MPGETHRGEAVLLSLDVQSAVRAVETLIDKVHAQVDEIRGSIRGFGDPAFTTVLGAIGELQAAAADDGQRLATKQQMDRIERVLGLLQRQLDSIELAIRRNR